MALLLSIVAYVGLLVAVSRATAKKGNTNVDFFIGGRRSPWWAVSLGMVGASISGVTFVSVPGWVTSTHFTYMQIVLGFIVGYVLVAYVLLPVYYASGEVSIYAILEKRLGKSGRRTAAVCFLLNKTFSSSVKLYVVVLVLHQLVFRQWGVPFWCVAAGSLLVVWLYTYKGGIRTIVWTDFLQTILLLVALVLLLRAAMQELGLDVVAAARTVWQSPLSETFVWDDWLSRQHFVKQFLSGVLIVFVMTGLDQDLMQKNLSCKSLKDAQRNVLSYGVLFVPLNLLFLSLGVLMVCLYTKGGEALPAVGDSLLPYFAQGAGSVAMVCFVIGMLASSFSSVDSAITAITTSLSVDFRQKPKTTAERIRLHAGVSLMFFLLVVALQYIPDEHSIDLIYKIVAFFYGPLLGLFLFALRRKSGGDEAFRWLPWVAVLSVALTWIAEKLLLQCAGYAMGYESLLLNGVLMYAGLRIEEKTM